MRVLLNGIRNDNFADDVLQQNKSLTAKNDNYNSDLKKKKKEQETSFFSDFPLCLFIAVGATRNFGMSEMSEKLVSLYDICFLAVGIWF